jgi:alkylation response protein AidB-like acyl-CoA dehydrogenase
LNGTKAYNMKSDRTDIGLCVARTGAGDTKYQGLTLLMVDLHARGVTVTPLPGIGPECFHRVEFHDVLVPDEAVVGAPGDGWRLLTQALPYERIGLDFALRAERWYRMARATVEDPELDADLGRYGARATAALLMARQAAKAVAAGRHDPVSTAMVKWFTCVTASEIGCWSARSRPPGRDDGSDARDAAYREAPGLTLSGGTTEMMLQLIAGFMIGSVQAEDPRDARV